MTVFYEAQDRISFALEGARLTAGDLLDATRERALIVLAGLAAVGAVALLVLTTGGTDAKIAQQSAPAPAAAAEAEVISERGYSLSLPADWLQTEAPDGASFSATSADGLSKTTLWAERAPGLGFGAFVDQSMESLDKLGTGVRISDEVGGPTLASKVTELRAEVPLDGGLSAAYHVVLRASGPYRYYLATSLQPGASQQLIADAELLGTSFRPQVAEKAPTP